MNIDNNMLDYAMWERLLDDEIVNGIKVLSGTDRYGVHVKDNETEDDDSIIKFFLYLIDNINYKVIVMIATQWNRFNLDKQVRVAVKYVGYIHASRFIMMMDLLSKRFVKGDLK